MSGLPTGSRVAVLGMGTMGAGIAQVFAQAGHPVVAVDSAPASVERGLASIADFLAAGVSRGKTTEAERTETLARIEGTTELEKIAGSGLVIEAVVEELTVKHELLRRVSPLVAEDALITSNTSALSLTELAVSVDSPQRFAGLHFFNPAQLMDLVEVVAALPTATETIATLIATAEAVGKKPVSTKDRPGFLVNRLLMPYLNQAVQAYDDEIADAEDIDIALELGLGYPIGPLKLLDIIGLDVHHHATDAAYAQTRDVHFSPPPLLSRMVDAGYLGKKSGTGLRLNPEDPK